MGSPVHGTRRRLRARAASLCLLVSAAAACADVLGIPGDPRVVEAPSAAVMGSGGGGTAEPLPPEPPTQAQSNSPGAETTPNPLPPSLTEPSSETHVPVAEPADAGAPPSNLADATASNGPCAASQSLGPNARCFALVEALQSWDAGRASCQALGQGWDLASIRSAAVNQFIAGLITGEAWIGASDLALEGTWTWADDGLAFWRGNAPNGGALGGAYANWNSTEPNGGINTNCARIVPAVGNTWADLECGMLLGAVCEGPLL